MFEIEKIAAFKRIITESKRFVIVCHKGPDGDALGSSLCLNHLLRRLGKESMVVTPDSYPANLSFLPGSEHVVIASHNYERVDSLLGRADTVMCLDFNELGRLDRLAPYVEKAAGKKVLIDHHLNPDGFADLTFSFPEISSTCALLYLILSAADLTAKVDAIGAACCCAGMMTDTGNFSYNSNDPKLYRIMAELVEKGINKDGIAKRLFDTSTERRIRIMGYCQSHNMSVFPEHKAALITLSKGECEEFGYEKGDTESLVNMPLSIPSIVWSVYLRETTSGIVRVSMRSKGDFSVRDICSAHFEGGGHCNAAGGEVAGTLEAAISAVLKVMPLYDGLLPASETIEPSIIL